MKKEGEGEELSKGATQTPTHTHTHNKVYNNFDFIIFNKTFPSFNLETLMRKCVSFHSREKTPSDVNS